MVKRIRILGAWASVLLGLAYGSAAWATKPADLPVPSQLACPDGTDGPEQGTFSLKLDLLTGRLSVEVTTGATDQPTPIDAVTPAFLPALFDHLLARMTNTAPAVGTELEARRCFELAEQARRSKDYQTARRAYQQTHLLAPTSPLGRLAITRLQEIEERMRDAAEEQTDPPVGIESSAAFSDMRSRTIPLGLVIVSY